jgi:Ca-activated chloride channel family protein
MGVLVAVMVAGWAASAQAAPVVGCRVELDRAVLPAGAEQTAVLKVTLLAPEAPNVADRPPVNLTLVLDRSGSMSGSKIDNAREAAIAAVRRLGGKDIFSLVIYDNEVETLVPAQSAGYVEWIEARIRAIQPRGNTALFSGVSQGAAEIRKHLGGPYVHRILLLSDGLANVGPSSPADLARLGAALVKEGISVTTIGVGTDFNEDLMTQLARNSDGNHYFVESSGDLPRIFARELGDVLSVVASQVEIEVECPGGVVPVRIIGRDGQILGNKVQLQMNQLYGGQEKYVLVEVRVPAAAAGSSAPIATAQCRYQNALSRQPETASARADVRFSADEQAVRESADLNVNQALISNEIAETRELALDLYNRGNVKGGAEMLRERQVELEQRLDRVGLSRVLSAPVSRLREEAQDYEMGAVDSGAKKAIRAENYQVMEQQQAY